MSHAMMISGVVFIITFILISSEKIHKVVATILGSTILIISGVMEQKEAFNFIDWNVLFLLSGMMIIVGIMKHTGVFQYIAIKTAKIAKGNPITIMLLLFIITAFVSSLLDNVTTIMIVIPVTMLVATELNISPIPFIITQAIASNIGGTATLIGDPPNIMIGSAAKLEFLTFITNLAPVVIAIMVVSLGLAYFIFKKKLHVSDALKANIMQFNERDAIADYPLLYKSGIVFMLFLAGLFTQSIHHLEAATMALFCAAILVLISGHKHVEKLIMEEIEWGTIVFFMGLFIVVGSLDKTGIIELIAVWLTKVTGGSLMKTSVALVWISGFASGVIDNIPFVATMIPIIKDIGAQVGIQQHLNPQQVAHVIQPLWWSLSLGACLGGNMTLIGASANVVSVGLAKKAGHTISFWDFTKYGIIFTMVSLIMSTAYILLRYFIL
ncbi:MAG TPA: ArsB/NhaD family transporter [Candidatus Cloacimonadota bacterium]|nr:ArsB/NhaD family transporter [Candidatus Cloacimonadota bacterium]HPT70933.1 ArsB/NhaD family transporter [Candidatus Cloacimonadota bacterium]